MSSFGYFRIDHVGQEENDVLQAMIAEGIEEHNIFTDMWQSGEITIREAAKKCNMPKSTFYGKAKKYLNKNVIS